MNKKKILVVGGTGYLGRHLINSFDESHFDITFTGTRHNNDNRCNIVLFEDEKTYLNLSQNYYDFVIILASKMNALGSLKLNHEDLFTNTIPYANFLQYLSDNKLTKKIIYVSSMTVYSKDNKSPVREDAIINPPNTYGLSKYIAELLTNFHTQNSKINSVVIRIPGIYGGDRKNGYIYNSMMKLKNNETIIMDTRNLVYWETINIQDLVEIVINFIVDYDWKNTFDIFNISYGEETDIYKTVLFLKKQFSSNSIIKEENKKGYAPIYLSNNKIKKYCNIKCDYYSSLKKYIKAFQ